MRDGRPLLNFKSARVKQPPQHLADMTMDERIDAVKEMGLPAFRAKQISTHYFSHYVTDTEAMDAFALLSRTEGIIPAIESAHALAGAVRVGRELAEAAGGAFAADDPERPVVLVNLSGRGDKDVDEVVRVADWDVGVPEEAYAEVDE